MNRNRYLLCLLLCGVMLYYAIPRISFEVTGMEGVFSLAWPILALFVIAGNLSAYLYTPRKQKRIIGKPEQGSRKTRKFAN